MQCNSNSTSFPIQYIQVYNSETRHYLYVLIYRKCRKLHLRPGIKTNPPPISPHTYKSFIERKQPEFILKLTRPLHGPRKSHLRDINLKRMGTICMTDTEFFPISFLSHKQINQSKDKTLRLNRYIPLPLHSIIHHRYFHTTTYINANTPTTLPPKL